MAATPALMNEAARGDVGFDWHHVRVARPIETSVVAGGANFPDVRMNKQAPQ